MIQTFGALDKRNLSAGDVLKVIGKQSLGRLRVYKLTNKPIFIFANRRGGSTLMMEMIYSQPRVDYVAQPLDLWQLHPHFDQLPHPLRSKFITLKGEEEERLAKYFTDLLAGRIRLRNQWRIFDRNFSFLVNRLVIKICNAHALIDWFNEHFDIHCLYLVRHPIATALSIINRGWGNDAGAYLRNEEFCREQLNPDQVVFGWYIFKHGTQLQRYVLEWCLENFVPLQLFQQRPWLTVTYEELVIRPKEISELICRRFDLPNSEQMWKVVLKPSRTTTQDSKRVIQRRGPRALVDRWMQKVSDKEIAEVQEVLNTFGIRVYKADSPFPHRELCHFGALEGD